MVGGVKCPGCATAMSVQRVISVDIDQCPGCGGIVLDKGESEVIEALGVARIIEGTLQAPAAEAPRTASARCYECARDMISLVGAGEVEYDWCDQCERLFFDRGELSAIEAFKPE